MPPGRGWAASGCESRHWLAALAPKKLEARSDRHLLADVSLSLSMGAIACGNTHLLLLFEIESHWPIRTDDRFDNLLIDWRFHPLIDV